MFLLVILKWKLYWCFGTVLVVGVTDLLGKDREDVAGDRKNRYVFGNSVPIDSLCLLC